MENIGELCSIKYDIKDNKFYFFDKDKKQIDSKFENYLACIILGIIGDIIGFGNGDIEFYNQNNIIKNAINDREEFINNILHISSFLIFEFILNNSTSQYDFKSNTYSDDTIMLLANLKALLSDYKDGKELYINTSNCYLEFFKDEKLLIDKYKAGIKTIESLRRIKNGISWKNFSYDIKAGGSGASMRSAVFGLAFHNPSHINNLIESTIETCAITHNNGIAFLGSFTNALFTSYAIQKIPI
jgi:ADP-ribosylglycohydrolase